MRTSAERTLPPEADADIDVASAATSRRGYRLFAPLYDHVFGSGLHQARQAAIEALECNAGERVLEVCIGSGLSLPLYRDDVEVVGIDLSGEMLALAAKRNACHKASAKRHLVQMNAERIAFADGTFDKAVVLFGVAGLPDPPRAMHELRRVCRPGARIVIASRFRSGASWFALFDLAVSPLYRLLAYRSDLDRDAFIRDSGLDVVDERTANLFGYSTILVCRCR